MTDNAGREGNGAGQADVATILADLREQVRERRALLTMREADDPRFEDLEALRQGISSMNDFWFVSAHLPITWHTPVIGPMLAYAKRLVRVLLRWYINPLAEQQNHFNWATARALEAMMAYEERLTGDLQRLEERIARLEVIQDRATRRDGEPREPGSDAGIS